MSEINYLLNKLNTACQNISHGTLDHRIFEFLPFSCFGRRWGHIRDIQVFSLVRAWAKKPFPKTIEDIFVSRIGEMCPISRHSNYLISYGGIQYRNEKDKSHFLFHFCAKVSNVKSGEVYLKDFMLIINPLVIASEEYAKVAKYLTKIVIPFATKAGISIVYMTEDALKGTFLKETLPKTVNSFSSVKELENAIPTLKYMYETLEF